MQKWLADVHMHVDYDEHRDRWHGERPEKLARQIVHETSLNLVALSEHNKVSDQYFALREEAERESEILRARSGTRRELWVVLGFELAMMFGKRRYHVGYVFEDVFQRGKLPEVPPYRSDARELEHYRIDYPGVAILNHPTWKDESQHDLDVTRDFMKSGLVDGAEIANGSIVFNGGTNMHVMRSSSELFVDVRQEQERVRKRAKHPDTPKSSLAPIGGSDAHHARNVGSIATEYMGDDPTDYFEQVRRGNTAVVPLQEEIVRERVQRVMRSVQHLRKYMRFPQ